VAHFERKGWPLRPCCYECSAKVSTATAQQKQLERKRAAKNVEQRRAPVEGPMQGRNRCPRQHGEKKLQAKAEEAAPTSAGRRSR